MLMDSLSLIIRIGLCDAISISFESTECMLIRKYVVLLKNRNNFDIVLSVDLTTDFVDFDVFLYLAFMIYLHLRSDTRSLTIRSQYLTTYAKIGQIK